MRTRLRISRSEHYCNRLEASPSQIQPQQLEIPEKNNEQQRKAKLALIEVDDELEFKEQNNQKDLSRWHSIKRNSSSVKPVTSQKYVPDIKNKRSQASKENFPLEFHCKLTKLRRCEKARYTLMPHQWKTNKTVCQYQESQPMKTLQQPTRKITTLKQIQQTKLESVQILLCHTEPAQRRYSTLQPVIDTSFSETHKRKYKRIRRKTLRSIEDEWEQSDSATKQHQLRAKKIYLNQLISPTGCFNYESCVPAYK